MLYKPSYFRKELRQAYAGDDAGTKRKLAFSLFLGLLSFSVFFILQTLKKSVLSDAAPQIMQTSYFSTVLIYIHSAFILNAVYYVIYYDALFFAEIRKNSWYLLIKTGYRPASMISAKFIALMSSVTLMYTAGFCLVVLLTALLEYTFVLAYLPSLYLAGLIDIVLLGLLAMTLSLFVKTVVNARYALLFSALLIPALKAAAGFYTVLLNRAAMQRLMNIFEIGRSPYMAVAGLVLLACCLVTVIRASHLAKYYVLADGDGLCLPPGATLRRDGGASDPLGPAPWRARRNKAVFNAGFTVLLVLLIGTVLAFNIFIILLSTAKPGSEITVRGAIPYIFQSDTMKPDIEYNDLAYFKRVDAQYPVSLGMIVLLEQDKVVYVERIVAKSGDTLTVDIDNYPPMSDTGSMLKTVPRGSVYGVYSGRNRWLGALILFSNTIVGRIAFLLIPALLLFYRKQILRFLRKEKAPS
jgi:hypothetical protein